MKIKFYTSLCILLFCFFSFAQIVSTSVVESEEGYELKDPRSVTLSPGFWAKSGSSVIVGIGYTDDEINFDCVVEASGTFSEIVDLGNYNPEEIDSTKLLSFSYDDAGNQTLVKLSDSYTTQTSTILSIETLSSLVVVYPNPSKGSIKVSWDAKIDDHISSVQLIRPDISYVTELIFETDGQVREAHVFIHGPVGYYFLNIQLTDGRSITKTIIKN